MTWQRKGGILRSVRVSRSQLLGNVLKCQLYQQNLNMMISTIHDDADRGEDDGDSNDDDNGGPPVLDLPQRLRYCFGQIMMMVMT